MAEIEQAMRFKVGTLNVEIYPSSESAGIAAARAAAHELRQLSSRRASIGVIFATGVSQLCVLRALTGTSDIPWNQVRGFHMDEYLGMDADHPASFRRYLRENLTQRVPMKEFSEIDGTAPEPERACREYAAKVRSADPQLCLLGIGENGHLAFNDPPGANFNDPLDMKLVHLDTVCRQQQAAEGWFKSVDEVPKSAMTLTIPILFRVPKLILSVLGSRKARIMRITLESPISTDCPSTILRTHPNATVYLDAKSAAGLVQEEWDDRLQQNQR